VFYMVRFCAICGKVPSGSESLIDNLCWDCYRDKHRLINAPKSVEVEICRHCYSYRLNRRWIQPRGDVDPIFAAAIEVVKSRVSLNGTGVFEVSPLEMVDRNRVKVKVSALGTVHPDIPKYREEVVVEVMLKYVSCPVCIKIASKYYIATLQIRADRRSISRSELEELVGLIENVVLRELKTDKSAYVVEFSEVDGGLDLKFANTRVARLIASKIRERTGASIKETFKVIGFNRSSGKRLSRLTISLRLPPFSLNDIIRVDDEILLLKDFRGGKFIAVNLASWSKISFSPKLLSSKNVVRIDSLHNLPRGLVVSVQGDFLQLMDLSSYEIYEVAKPVELDLKSGDEVQFIKLEDKIFIANLL